MRSIYSESQTTEAVVADLLRAFDTEAPRLVSFFTSPRHDGAAIGAALSSRFPEAAVIGCETAGEFTGTHYGVGGVAALALGASQVVRCVSALAPLEAGTDTAMAQACDKLATAIGKPLRELDATRYVGLVLIDGMHGCEERVNELLGNRAPMLSFVGGSAGDDLQFKQTRVFRGGESTGHGAVLALCEMATPFWIMKSCSFESTGATFRITRADEPRRVVYELDGHPAPQAYAAALGIAPEKLDGRVFMDHPVGLVMDGQPWIRSPQQVLPDGGLKFYCRIEQGMEVHLMRSTDLVGETRKALAEARERIGDISAALLFNCILRHLEIEAKGLKGQFLESFKGIEAAGFHTYGESWMGHINQTITGLLIR